MDNVKFSYSSVFAVDVTFPVFAALRDYYKDLEGKREW